MRSASPATAPLSHYREFRTVLTDNRADLAQMQGSVELTESPGVSIGTTNLVAARPGQAPVTRGSVLTLWDERPAKWAPGAGGTVSARFVERVGDPVPLVAADGSAHRGEALTAEAVEALALRGRRAARVPGGGGGARALGPGAVGAPAARCAIAFGVAGRRSPCWCPMPPPHFTASPSTPPSRSRSDRQ